MLGNDEWVVVFSQIAKYEWRRQPIASTQLAEIYNLFYCRLML